MQAHLQYLAEKSEKIPVSSVGLSLGQFVLFKSGGDWYRGVVVKMKEGKVKMFSPDFGFSSRSFRVTEENLQPIPGGVSGRAKFWASPCSLGQNYNQLNMGGKKGGDKLELSVVSVERIKYIIQNH